MDWNMTGGRGVDLNGTGGSGVDWNWTGGRGVDWNGTGGIVDSSLGWSSNHITYLVQKISVKSVLLSGNLFLPVYYDLPHCHAMPCHATRETGF